jgi:hypothetical protein
MSNRGLWTTCSTVVRRILVGRSGVSLDYVPYVALACLLLAVSAGCPHQPSSQGTPEATKTKPVVGTTPQVP